MEQLLLSYSSTAETTGSNQTNDIKLVKINITNLVLELNFKSY